MHVTPPVTSNVILTIAVSNGESQNELVQMIAMGENEMSDETTQVKISVQKKVMVVGQK